MFHENGLLVKAIAVIVVTVLGSCLPCLAVQRDVPAAYPTVQAAIDASASGDVVVLAAGTYTGTGYRDLNFKGKAVLVQSADPLDPTVVAATVLDCQGTAASPHRAATLNCSSATYEAGLAGLTVTGAYDADGAVVCDVYSSPVVRNCVIRNNSGSGIFASANANPLISDCRIEDNVVDSDGGGICLALECRPTIEGCIIRGNNAAAAGGGIYCYEGWPAVLDSEISGNYAASGGGVYWQDSAVSLENCTVAGNSSQVGGGLCGLSIIYYDLSNIHNSIVWGNHSTDGLQVALTVSAHVGPQTDTLTVGYSLIQGGQASIPVPTGWTLVWKSSNLPGDTDPGFVSADGPDGKWDTWQDNGYRLASGSACINVGDPTGNYASRLDADGQSRLIGSQVDLGAYEYIVKYSQGGLVGDANGDGHVDLMDLTLFAGSFGLAKGQPGFLGPCDFNGDGSVDMIDLLMLADNFGT